MSAILGGGGETASPGALLDSEVESIIEEKNQLISRQYAEIERLQRELAEVVGERDALLCEVSKFKFEREMTDLKRLHDDRYVPWRASRSPAFSGRSSFPCLESGERGRNAESYSAYKRFFFFFFYLARLFLLSVPPRFDFNAESVTRHGEPEKDEPR